MTEAAEECLGFKQPVRNKWFDERKERERVRKLQREKKSLLRKKHRQHDQQMIADVENLHSINDIRNFYHATNRAKKGFQPRTFMCRKKVVDLVCDWRCSGTMEGALRRTSQFRDKRHANYSEVAAVRS